MALIALAAAVPAYLQRRRASLGESPPMVRSLAVPPLTNASGDPQREYPADGLTEALTGSLGRIGALRVISRASAMQYKATKKPVSGIGRELNAEAVGRGTIARFGDRVQISLELVQASTGRQL